MIAFIKTRLKTAAHWIVAVLMLFIGIGGAIKVGEMTTTAWRWLPGIFGL